MSNNVLRKLLTFAVFILFLAIFSESASAAITACGTVSASDSLTQNISSADTCLSVTTSNVNINCNGFSITFNTGVAAPPSFGVYALSASNITVRNCILIDANASSPRKAGVFFENVTGGNISNNTVTIRGRGNAAVFRIEGSSVTIQNNRADVTTEDFSTGNITNGILLHYGSNHRVLNNVINATGNGGPGLLYSNNSNSCVFSGNNITSNASGNGVELRDTINCAISDNTVTLNPGGTPNGIAVNIINNVSSSNNVTSNRVTLNGAGASGAITIGANSSNNVSFNNITVISATARGIQSASTGSNFFHNNIINMSNSNSSGARAFESQALQPVGLFTDNIVLINSNLCNQLGLVYLDRVRHGTFERNNLTILCQGTSHIAGFYILNATNLTFRNNIINISTSNSNWFRVNQASFNTTFINTTFTDNNGLATFFSFVNATSSFVNRTQFNFTNSTIFVNTTNLTYLNTSAQVTLFNPVSAMNPPKLGVDFEDDGTFVPCSDSVCRVLSSSSTALTFNVTRFTSFSSSSFFPAVVNETSNLTSNITANGSAFIINASNIVFDCQGFTITGNGTGVGVNSTGFTNVTIRNCIIVNFNQNVLFSSTNSSFVFNTTTINSTQEGIEQTSSSHNIMSEISASGNSTSFPAFNITGGSNNTLANSTITAISTGTIVLDTSTANNTIRSVNTSCGGSADCIQIDNSVNNTILNVISTGTGSSTSPIVLTSSSNNRISNSQFYSAGTSLRLVGAINNFFSNNTVAANTGTAISIASGSNNNNFTSTRIETNSTWISSSTSTGNNLTNTTFLNSNTGSIRTFNNFTVPTTVTISLTNLNISYNRSFINSTNLSFLSQSSQVTLHNITVNATAVDFNDDGTYEACNATQCQIESFNGSTIIFNVSSFTSYSAMNLSSNSPPVVANVTLTATTAQNSTDDNLTVAFNVTAADGDSTTNTTDWRVNGISMAVLNLPFEAGTSNSSFTDDFSTYENNGNVTGATFNSSGGYNGFGAYQFDGNDYISVADNVSLQFPYGQFTLSAWVNPSSLPAIAGIIGKDDGVGNDVYQLRLDSGVLTGFVRDGANIASVPSGATLSTNQWTFVALVQNSTAVQLYVNGTVSGSAVSVSGTGNISPTNTLYIGDLLSPPSFPFSGVIDDVRIYNRSLSPQQLLAIYNNRTNLIVSQETQTGDVWQSCVTPNDMTQNGSTVCSNNLTINAPGAACPGSITVDTNLTSDVSSATGCVTFSASGITLDCNGYTMTWDTGGTGSDGIEANSVTNITIKNCVMNDGNSGGNDGYGITFSAVTNSFIINNTIQTNGTDTNYGIRLASASNRNLIANNTVRSNGSGNENTGIFLDTSNNSLIFNNTILPYGGGSNPHGIEFSNANDNNITQNNITKLTNVGNAIRFGNTCQRNIINGNYIDMTSDGQNTIEMNNNYQNTTIINNYIADGGFRGVLSNANGENLNVTNNTIFLRQNTVVVGILINTQGSVANNNRIFINTSNSAYGIRSTGVSIGTISNNYISFNTTASGYGISLEDTTDSVISGNNVSINSTTTDNRGIRTQGTTTGNNITNNFLNVNGSGTNYGIIFTANTNYNTIENNNIRVQTGSQNEGIHSNTGSSNTFRNNNITVFGSLNNRGIRFFNNANNNTANNNYINVNGTTSYGIFVDGTSNRFDNNTLNDTTEWLQTSTGAQGNFTNTTFQTNNGSIFISGLVQLDNVKLVTRNVLNISLNSAYVNSTNMSALNQSAQILLRNVPPSNPQPIVDFEDDGTFVACNSPQCVVINSSNITFVMNVSSFTNYSTEDSISCGSTLTSSTTLTENLTCPGTAFVIGANNVALDCNGNYIAYGGNGSNNQVAINASGVSGVSIRNCVIHDYNSSGSDGYGIWFTHVNNSVISNNIITTNGTTTNYGIRINGSTTNVNNTVTNNTINAVGSSNNNIGVYAGRIHILNISQNSISTSGSTGNDGISLQITVTNATVNDNVVSAGGITSAVVGILTSSVVNSTFHRNRVQTIGSGARFTDSSDLSIENNSINGSVGGGVNIENAGRTSLIGNNISSSSGSGLTYTGLFGSGNHLADSNRINGTEGVSYGSTQPNSNLTNNNITATNGHGIVINSNSPTIYLNNNILTMSPPSGGPFYGVDIGATNNSIVNNLNLTILGNTAWMRTTVAGRTTNFTNTTLRNNNGSVFYLGTFQLENQSAVELTSLNISTNRVRLNSSTVPFLNRSAQIILNNVNTSIPIVDFEDDGTYQLCNATQCQLQSFNGSTVVFNVSSFTSYSTSSGGVNVTLTKTDNPDPVPNGSYLNYTITFNVTGGTAYNITINETYPNNVTFVNATPSPTSGNNSWNAGNLTASQNYQINITVLVASNLAGGTILTNTINATYENSSGTQFLINVSENTTVSVPLDPPVLTNVTLYATSTANTTDDNLTVAFNLTSPGTMNPAWNITDWRMNASSIVFFQYPFETFVNDTSTSLRDYGTSNISATLGNGASSAVPNWTTGGQVGAAFNFDGTDDQINISDTRNPTEYSIEVWVRPDANTSRNIFVRTAGNPLTSWSHQLRISSGSVFQHMAFDGATILVTGTTGVVPGNWYHVVGTAENGGNLSLYVNGAQDGSNATLGTLWTGGNQYRIGSNSGDAMSFFDGIIDEVRLYNRSLTSSEIALLYNEGLANRQPTKLHSSETETGEVWSVAVTPNNHDYEGNTTLTNNLTIRPAAAACPGVITTDTNLTENITVATSGACVQFGADNIVLDCQGYTMTGNGSGVGINATSRTNVEIRNCNVATFNRNILFSGTSNSRLLSSNTTNSTDINIFFSTSGSNNNLSNLVVNHNATTADAIQFFVAGANQLRNISIFLRGTGGSGAGVYFFGSSDNSLDNLTSYAESTFYDHVQITSTALRNNVSNIVVSNGSMLSASTSSNFIIFNNARGTNSIVSISTANNIVDNVTLTGSSSSQMFTASGSSSNYSNINVSNSGGQGVALGGSADRIINLTTIGTIGMTVTGSTNALENIQSNATGIGQNSILISGSNNNVRNVTSQAGSGIGIGVSVASGNNISEFTVNEGYLSPISIQSGATNTIFTNGTINSNPTCSNCDGIALSALTNAILDNITIVSPTSSLFDWISTAASTSNASISNITFQTSSGSIKTIQNTTLPGPLNLNRDRLNISPNRAFLNSTNLTFLNVSAQITLTNVNSSVLLVDFEDDGTFALCSPPQCVLQSFSSGTVVFNVSSFTSYSTSNFGGVNVTLSKSDSPDPINLSNTTLLTYQINFTVTNGTAFNVTINETYPNNTTFINSSPTASSGNDGWNVGNLTAGQTYQINITINVSSSLANGTSLINTISATYENSTGNQFNLSVSEATIVINEVVVQTNATLTKTDSPDPLNISNSTLLTYQINFTVTNGTAYNIVINDTYPGNATFVNATPSPTTGNNSWSAGNISATNTYQINITVNVSNSLANGTIITNTVNTTYNNATGSTLTTNVQENTTIIRNLEFNATAITLTKTDAPDPVVAGQNLVYTITINVTNGTAFNTTLTDSYPPQVSFVSATPAANSSNNTWIVGNLSAGQSFQVNITVNVNSTTANGTTINNTANISYANQTGSILTLNVTTQTLVSTQSFPIVINNNTNITTNGSTTGPGIIINSSNVTVNCNNNIITGSGGSVGVNITGFNNVTIQNCVFVNFATGAYVENSNNNQFTSNTFRTVTSGVNLLGTSQNSAFNHTTIAASSDWILTSAASSGNVFQNTSYNDTGGQIIITPSVTFAANTNASQSRLDITSPEAFLNSSALSFLDVASRVTINGINNTATALILGDFDDDGTYEICSAPSCALISFASGTAIFDTSGWTSYTVVDGGVNFTLTKTSSPDPVTPGNNVVFTITATVNSGFAQNITVVESPPAELTFVTSTPTNISANTWLLNNLSAGQSAQINVTYSVNSSFTGTIVNNVSVTFQNSTNGTISTNVSQNTTAQTPSPSGGGGGGGGGGSSASICPPFCQYPENKDLPVCRNNCPPAQAPAQQDFGSMFPPVSDVVPPTIEETVEEPVIEEEAVVEETPVEEPKPVKSKFFPWWYVLIAVIAIVFMIWETHNIVSKIHKPSKEQSKLDKIDKDIIRMKKMLKKK